ncbi:MAG: VOC family protein [Halobacteriota archaeon]
MQFTRVTLPAVDPESLATWYEDVLAVPIDRDADADRPTVTLGRTTIEFVHADGDPAAYHVAFRSRAPVPAIRRWLVGRTQCFDVEGEPTIRFDFLDADAVYFGDPEGNVLECLHYDRDRDRRQRPGRGAFLAVTEVGLPSPTPVVLRTWVTESIGLPTMGSPSESFAWVGDLDARFVVVPAGRSWYPTDRPSGIDPIAVTIDAPDVPAGVYTHPDHPYEITVEGDRSETERE